MDTLTQKIKELQQKGLSIRAIAREVGLSHVAVMKRLKRDKASGNQNGNLGGNLTGKLSNQEKWYLML